MSENEEVFFFVVPINLLNKHNLEKRLQLIRFEVSFDVCLILLLGVNLFFGLLPML